MAAAATLLGMVPGKSAAASPDPWTWETSFTHYHESDRISVVKPQIGVRRDLGEERAISVLATVDTISGSTPLGTLPPTINTAPNTTTGASGRLVNPYVGKVPTSKMTDTRIALNTSYERPFSSLSRGQFGANVAREKDFLSAGVNSTYHRDFNQKNTTFSFGVSPEFDWVSPTGGLPRPYATRLAADEYQGSTDPKVILGGLVGLTQVLSKRLYMQWNYSPTYENGYLHDPYKLLSIVNAAGDPVSVIHEKRPDSRLEHSFFWLTKYNLIHQDVFSLGLRYFADDWGVRSQTIDFTYRWQVRRHVFFEPHVRYYHQTKADFFRSGIRDTETLPENASADYRLSDIDGVTIGLKVGWTFKNETELVVRAEYYSQTGESRPNDAVGVQRNYDLFPTLHASILQVDYRFAPSKLFRSTSRR